MTRGAAFAFVAMAALAACRDKQPAKQAAPVSQAVPADPGWIDRLPEAPFATQLMLDRATGLVGIAADGSIVAAKPPTQPAADPHTLANDPVAGGAKTTVDGVTAALELPAVAQRAPTAFEGEGVGSATGDENPIDAQFARLAHPFAASGAPLPAKRTTSAFGLAHDHDVSAGVVVFAAAQAPATALVDVVGRTGGFIAVRTQRSLGALPIAFDRQTPSPGDPTATWVEVRLGRAIELETVPGKAVAVPAIAQLADAVTAAKATAVDVLVAPETTVQDVVAAVVALRAAKVESIGLGRAPAAGSPEASARGEHGPRVLAWNTSLVVDVDTDATPYRAALDATLEPIRACYAKLAATKADLGGIARVQIALAQKTGAAAATVTDVPAPLASCVTTAINSAKFPGAPAQVGMLAKLAFLP